MQKLCQKRFDSGNHRYKCKDYGCNFKIGDRRGKIRREKALYLYNF
jgi:hypothetical protein